jgi:lauroyl/myristoyl acyltransferase
MLVRLLLGLLSVLILEGIARLPFQLTLAAGSLLLPFYLPFRHRTRARLRAQRPPVSAWTYYRMRLRLILISLQQLTERPDGCTLRVEGSSCFEDALASGKPVVLLGWHQGPVELLHKLPAQAAGNRGAGHPFFVMTASAFSPALASWMARKRRLGGSTFVRVVRPNETDALRAWARSTGPSGILAVMVDQVPGTPEEWLPIAIGTGSNVRIPYPKRLMEWIAARNPVYVVVSVRLDKGNRIVFRYERLTLNADADASDTAKSADAVRRKLSEGISESIATAPEQYNWSYGKIRVVR